MAGGKGSAGLSFSLGLIPALLLAQRGPDGRLAALAAAGTAAAAAVTLLPLQAPRARWCGVLLLAAALGGAAGLARGALRPAVPAAAALLGATRFEGVLAEDSRTGTGGDTLYVLRLEQVHRGAEGIRTPARGRALLRVREGPRAWRGQRLAARGALRLWQAAPAPGGPAVRRPPAISPGGRRAAA